MRLSDSLARKIWKGTALPVLHLLGPGSSRLWGRLARSFAQLMYEILVTQSRSTEACPVA